MMYFFELLKTHMYVLSAMRRLWILVVMCFWVVLFTFGCAVTTGQKFHHENRICIWKGGAINKWWFIFSLLLFFLPSPPSTLSLGSPEQLLQSWGMQAEGNTQRGKTRPLNNSFAFSSPRHPNIYSLIPSIISWFKQRTIITLHCHSSNSSE